MSTKFRIAFTFVVVGLASSLFGSGSTVASPEATKKQEAQSNEKPSSETKEDDKKAAPQPDAKQSLLGIPSGPAQSVLIRRILLTLNDANQTGNYTVLRDIGAPGFASANSAAKLGAIFASLRGSNLDLSPIVLFDPKLVKPPKIDDNGMLRLTGFIPTAPQQVNFDLMFQNLNSKWKLFGIAVNTSPAQAVGGAIQSNE